MNELSLVQVAWSEAVRALAKTPGILLDIGGGSPYQGHIRHADVGSDSLYFCVDISASGNPHIIGDILALPFPNGIADAILCNAVLEHVHAPQQAVNELYRILKPQGRLLVGVPFLYPYHDRIDYYRFTEDGLRYLFRDFVDVTIMPYGDYFYATLSLLTGFGSASMRFIAPIARIIRAILVRILAYAENTSLSQARRQYVRSFYQSPIGWYLSCSKL